MKLVVVLSVVFLMVSVFTVNTVNAKDEGFSGRKPIDPRDADYRNPIQ